MRCVDCQVRIVDGYLRHITTVNEGSVGEDNCTRGERSPKVRRGVYDDVHVST